MSHFAVLVVGDVDHNMAPFHEFECDGRDDEFIQDIDKTEEYRKDFEKAKARYAKEVAEGADAQTTRYSFKGSTFREYLTDYCGLKSLEIGEELDLKEKHKFGYAKHLGGDDFQVIDRTNPNKFYDYYGSGYRAFKLFGKKDVRVNEAYKANIDFDGMFEEAERKARELYRKVIAAMGYKEGKHPKMKYTWAQLVDKFYPSQEGVEPEMTRAQADALYKNQAAVKRFARAQKAGRINWQELGCWGKVDDFNMSEDDYVKSQCIHSLSYGFVIDRKYYSRGKMGWWAISTGECSPEEWDAQYKKFLDELPDDAYLTMLDCHI